MPGVGVGLLRRRRPASGVALLRRMVGTLNDFPNTQRPSGGTNTHFNTVRCVWLKDGVVNPSAVYVGWTSGNGEADNANAITVRTALYSYDLATLHGEFLRSGSVDHVVAAGAAWSETDQLSLTLPPGMYKLVTHGFVSSGQNFHATDYGRNNTIGARSEVGVGLADKHLSPSTISNAVANNLFMPPVGLMGSVPASRRLFGLPGDSISVGVGGAFNSAWEGATGASASGGVGYMAMVLDGLADYLHLGRSGYAALTAVGSSFTRRLAFMSPAGVTDLWTNLGINDLNSSNRTAAQLQGNCATMYGQWKTSAGSGVRIWHSTLTPATDTGNAAPTANVADDSRLDFNAWLRAGGISNLDGFVEAAVPSQSGGDANLWGAGYTTDGLHPNATGGAAIKAAIRAAMPF